MTAKKELLGVLLVATVMVLAQDILVLLEIIKSKGNHSSKSLSVTHNLLRFVP